MKISGQQKIVIYEQKQWFRSGAPKVQSQNGQEFSQKFGTFVVCK